MKAAFQATFTDWRLIKGRKVVQVVFEVPVEAADEAYQVLGGMPDPGRSVWCAIARLQQERQVMPTTVGTINGPLPKPVSDANRIETPARATTPTQMAGILCNDPLFQKYIGAVDSDEAAVKVRTLCHVTSRKDITLDNKAWQELCGRYLAWRMPQVVQVMA